MPWMRRDKFIIKTSEKQIIAWSWLLVNTRKFLFHLVLIHAIAGIKTSLSSPANMQSRKDMSLGPFNHLLEFLPIVHRLKRQMLYWRSCDNQAIKETMFDLIKSLVKGLHMFHLGGLWRMRSHIKKLNGQLQGRIGQMTQNLSFRHHFLGHEIEYQDIQGANILMICPVIIHDKDILRA